MVYRFTLAAFMAMMTLTGCAGNNPADNQAATGFSSGPTTINVSHVVNRVDDGSDIFLTVDGKEVGLLGDGDDIALRVQPGTHQIGGYVPTLFGFGRVTIAPVEVTASHGETKYVAYSVSRNKAGFTEQSQEPG